MNSPKEIFRTIHADKNGYVRDLGCLAQVNPGDTIHAIVRHRTAGGTKQIQFLIIRPIGTSDDSARYGDHEITLSKMIADCLSGYTLSKNKGQFCVDINFDKGEECVRTLSEFLFGVNDALFHNEI